MASGPKSPQTDKKEDVLVKEREKTKIPPKYKVIFHNDDFTPMEFVTEVLVQLFHHSPAAATRIMLTVHRTGIGVAGIYSREIAESKAQKTTQVAREYQYPLLVTTEPE